MKLEGHLQVNKTLFSDTFGEVAYKDDISPGFYGINVKQSDDAASFIGINTVAFNTDSFYLTQNSPNTDEAVVNFRGLTSTTRIGHTWAISGEISVPSGDTDFINPFFVSLASGQKMNLVKARYRINSGTSATVKLQKNGVDIAGFTGISVTTTTANTDPADIPLADDDQIALVVTAVAGTPTNMSFTVFFEFIT
jgi:hypothetical protein